MNILVLSWRDPKHPLAGGAEQVVHEHCKGWIENGNYVTLFSSYFKGANRVENIDGVLVRRFGFQLLGVHIAAFFWYLFVNKDKYDLVIDQFHGIPFFTPLYVRVKKLAIIQEVAREIWFANPLPQPLKWVVGIVGYTLEPMFFIPYRSVPFITGSESAKSDLIRVGIPETNIKVIPHGVIIENIQNKNKKELVNTIIFLGALTRDKGVEDAIDSFFQLNKKGKYKFWVVGRGAPEYISFLKEKSKKLGILKKTSFFGFVTQEKKFELLSRAHVLINPSIREGWGLVNIEANAMGTPIVCYKSAGLVDSVKEGVNGYFASSNTPEGLANQISDLLSNKQKYEKIRSSAVSWSRKFSWKNSRIMSLNLINEITHAK